MRRALLAAVLTGLCACPAPVDTTPQVHVTPGKAALWGALFSPPPASAAASPSRAHKMAAGEELGGPNAIGRAGDLVLENDEVVFVIDQLGSSAGFAESGGNLIDAADARQRKDELGQLFTYFGKFPRQAVYDALTTGDSTDGAAWVEVSGRELLEPKLLVTTRYTLRAGDRALLLETTLKNTGDARVDLPSVGDAIQWGGAEKTAPGQPRGFKGPSSGAYVGGVGRFVSYAAASLEGSIEAVSGSSWTDTSVRKSITLGPGDETKYARVFLVGERPDTSSLVSELAIASGAVGASGRGHLTLEVTSGGAAVPIPADAEVTACEPSCEAAQSMLTVHAAGDPGKLEAGLPAGHWTLLYRGGGRAATAPVQVDLGPGVDVRAKLDVSAASSVHIACVDEAGSALPCKVTFERTDGSAPPDFGVPHVAGPARNQVTTTGGLVDLALEPGAYRVTASRGPEYTLGQTPLVLAPGDHGELRLAIRRVVDTAGYLACDFHQHSMHSADSPVSLTDRVISNVAEGVEVAVASEHNDVVDLEPIVRALHLEGEFVSIAGDELTSDASEHPWGHANVFPLGYDGAKPRGGAPAVRDRTPSEVWTELRKAAPSDVVVQVNHPRSGQTGYFDLLGFDPKTGVGASPAYDATFDALEVWNGRNVSARPRVLEDYRALLRTGHPVTAVANTDTHGIVGQEAGYPRTYVRVDDDGHLAAWDGARTQSIVRGIKTLRDVVLTNGPMLRVTASGARIGGLASGKTLNVDVRVASAPWVVVDKVSVVLASGTERSKVVAEKPTASGALAAHVTFTVNVVADDALFVVAEGSRPMVPVLGPEGDAALLPWAMTGAVWVDADGDGESLGRKAP